MEARLEVLGSEEPEPRFRTGDTICAGLRAWEQLGDGRRTECWLAWSERLWSHVVVKLPRPDHLHDARTRAGLAREACTLERLRHPSIQRLLADAHRDPLAHLVLEYVEGPTLETLVEDEGPLMPGDVIRVGMQIASALHHVHGRGMVHLDLTPANIVLRDGRAVLMDLDVAREAGETDSSPRGTPAYMAPEQCRLAPHSPPMDLYALGAVLYELATGRQPFPQDEGDRDEYPQLTRSPIPVRTLEPSVPMALEVVVHALLERDLRRRPQTALEALGLLAAALPDDEEPLWPQFVGRLLERRR
jgi:serine/threonine protein kinase